MGEAEPRSPVRWIVPALIAALGIGLLVTLSTPPEMTLPARPDESDHDTGGNDRPPPELPDPVSYSGRIEGRVLRNGKGVAAGLTLLVYKRFPGRPLRHGRSGASGFFAFEDVPPGIHEISAGGPEGARIRRRVTVPAGVDPKFIKLALPGTSVSLYGRAIYADGRPFTGEVEILWSAAGDLRAYPTRADGRFTITGIGAGSVTPCFRSGRSFYARGRSVVLPAEDEVLFVVDEGARAIRGRVFDSLSGAPVAGAEVEIDGRGASGVTIRLRMKSAADGSFSAAVPMSDGRVDDVMVTAGGFRPWRLSRFPLTGEIEIALEPSARLRVRVVQAKGGAPVPLVPVKASFQSLPDVNEWKTLLTDRHGRVVFSSISGDTVRLDVRGHGYATDDRIQPEEQRCFTLTPGEEREVELLVTRSVVLMGVVTTAAGDPVKDGWVGYKTSGISGSKRLNKGHEFILEDLLPGDFWLRASRVGLLGEVITGTLAPGEVRSFELALEAGAWLLAEVRGEDTGMPLEGASVQLSHGGGTRRTNETGQVRFGPFCPRTKTAEVWCEGYCVFRQQVRCVAGRTTPLVATLSRGMSIAGKVLLSGGTPASGAKVRLSGRGFPAYRYRTRAADDGSFLLRGLPSCRVIVSASLRDADGGLHQGHQTLATGTTDAIIGLERTEEVTYRKIRLQVRDGEGALVPKAEFEVVKESPTDYEFGSDSGWIVNGIGAFEMDPEATSFRLYVHGARRPSSIPLPLGDAVFGPWPASVERVEVVLPEGRVTTGKVLGPGGEGVPGVEVLGQRAWWPEREPVYRFPWRAWTGADGAFTIQGLGAGTVTLRVEVPEKMVQVAPVVVGAGERGVIIRLDALVSAVITVRDREGRPVKSAFVEVWNQARIESGGFPEESVGSGNTNGRGRARLEDLPGATRHILTVRNFGSADLAPVRIDDWVPGDTEVTMSPGLSISGKVVRPDGTPDPGNEGRVWAWGYARGWEDVTIGTGGAFRESGFAEGRIALIWLPPGIDGYEVLVREPDKYDWPVTWVRAGAEDIVFQLPSR